ncbi:hypothetical protein B5X24_HaOG205243 [Helicoverpa armigera]|uniref:Uncharacterized protein n=1 Tax=Helicoverpa armigera TaxID=29058 RepID=A0A2W1BLN0_HELAM|nr:hypothetical protein B5X24_HaOG205243 [Helicoverpa armigera]
MIALHLIKGECEIVCVAPSSGRVPASDQLGRAARDAEPKSLIAALLPPLHATLRSRSGAAPALNHDLNPLTHYTGSLTPQCSYTSTLPYRLLTTVPLTIQMASDLSLYYSIYVIVD